MDERRVDDVADAGARTLAPPRYSAANQAFHWITALLMAAILPLGWIMADEGPTRARLVLWEWHKTLGLVVLALTAARIVWRFVDGPPPRGEQAGWEHALARLVYVLFFAVMIAMPVSGYMMSAGAGYPPRLFDLIPTAPLLAKDAQTLAIGATLHRLGQYAVYPLLFLHLAAVVLHVVHRRDGTLDRMLPEPR